MADQFNDGPVMIGPEAVAEKKVGGDFDVGMAAIDSYQFLESSSNLLDVEWFVEAGKGDGIRRFESDVDIGSHWHSIERFQ